jgi:hypothetical protein
MLAPFDRADEIRVRFWPIATDIAPQPNVHFRSKRRVAKARSAVPTRSFTEANQQVAAAVGERKRVARRAD